MNNLEFLDKVKDSFYKYLETGPRSNEKLKILHGAISKDISLNLGNDYEVHSLGLGDDKEIDMEGRYMDKKVDIGIKKDNEVIAGLALKFIMSNYSQNSNNYFENMLGETANIRSKGNPYFQIIILPSKVPYFKSDGTISKIENISKHYLSKYIELSKDNVDSFMHTPNKTLLYLVDIPEIPENVKNKEDYINFYNSHKGFNITQNDEVYEFGSTVIYNDYTQFINKVCYYIKSI